MNNETLTFISLYMFSRYIYIYIHDNIKKKILTNIFN